MEKGSLACRPPIIHSASLEDGRVIMARKHVTNERLYRRGDKRALEDVVVCQVSPRQDLATANSWRTRARFGDLRGKAGQSQASAGILIIGPFLSPCVSSTHTSCQTRLFSRVVARVGAGSRFRAGRG